MAAGKRDIERVLVRAPNWIGDAVMCLPALEALARLYRGAAVTVLARPRVAPVFEASAVVDGIIVYDSRGAHRGVGGRLRLAGELRRERFDVAVLFQNAFDAAFISFISGIPERAGYARDLRSPLLTRPVRVTPEIRRVHQVRYYLNIIKELGGRVLSRPMPRIGITGEEAAWARGFMEGHGLKGRAMVAASPGASYGQAKRWPPERFAEVIGALAERHDAVPVVFGGAEDREICNEISLVLGAGCPGALNLAGTVSLRQFMALLARSDVFITNDSGPMHVASALGVPTVALFGSTDPELTGPLGEEALVIRHDIECSPCFERECRYGHYRCLTGITAAEVLRSAEGLIRRRAKGEGPR